MSKDKIALILVRGGGDLATGVALRLYHAGMKVIITELSQPLAVRRAVSFAEAVYEGEHTVEEVTARLVKQGQARTELYPRISAALDANMVPVLVDPEADVLLSSLYFPVVIDARLTKRTPAPLPVEPALHIGLGPGFHAGRNCQAVIETRRSHMLGRVYWSGMTQPDSGVPEGDPRRVLRAPHAGVLVAKVRIGDHVEEGQVIAEILGHVILSKEESLQQDIRDSSPAAQSDMEIVSPFSGVVRGIIRDGIQVTKGLKIGDVDPRDDPSICYLVSDKSLAVGGGVLEAVLSKEEIRKKLF